MLLPNAVAPPAATTSSVQPSSLYAWSLLGLLTFLNVINFVDRELISGLQDYLKADLKLTNTQVMLLAGYAFTTLYCFFGVVLGSVADRWNRPRLIAIGLAVWSASTALSGLATSFWDLGLARIMVGIGEATLTPAAVAMLGDVFKPGRRALATGIYYLGIPLGAGMSYIVGGKLAPADMLGWRGCFMLLGVLGLLMVAVMLLFVKDPPRGGMESVKSRAHASRPIGMVFYDIVSTLTRSPALAMTMLGASLLNIGVGASWLTRSWLIFERGFSPQQAGLFQGVCFMIGGSIGNLLGGWLGDRIHRNYSSGRLLALIVLQVSIMPISICFRFMSPETFLFPVAFVLSSILTTFMYGPVLATVQELSPVRLRATMVACLLIGQNMIGAALGSVVAAHLVDHHLHSYTWSIFFVGLAGLLAIPLFAMSAMRYDIDLARVRNEAAAHAASIPVPAK